MNSLGLGCGVFLSLMLMSPMLASADDIRVKNYKYAYGDTVKPMEDDAFVVCTDCGTDKLVRLPKQFVSIRVNTPLMVALKESDNKTVFQNKGSAATSEDRVAGQAKTADNRPMLSLTDILFRFDRDVLEKGEKGRLDKIITTLPKDSVLDVTGYTCTIGPKAYNQKLSERRAHTVADYLRKRGVAIKDVEGKGECCPVAEDKSKNRRVVIKRGNNAFTEK